MALEDLLSRDDLPKGVREAIREEVAERRRSGEKRSAAQAETPVAGEGALLVGEEAFRNMFRGHAAVMYVVDLASFSIIDANGAALRFYGYDRETMLTKRVPDLNITPAKEIRAEIARAVDEGRSHYVFQHQLASGEVRDIEVYANPISIRGKDLSFSIVHDITERKHAEEALRRYERIFSASTNHMALVDRNYVYQIVNDAYCKGQGTARERIVGHSVPDLFGEDVFRKKQKPNIDRCLAGETIRYQLWVSLPTQGRRFMDVAHHPYVEDDGSISGYVVNARDITEQKRLEEQLQHAQKLKSLGILASGVAHDFNNLLVGMLGHASLALKKLPTESPARPNIEQVMQAAERATDLSRQMLAYSGHGHFVVKPTDLSALVRENVHLLKAGIPKGVQLRTILSGGPAMIEADAGQMQQVIMNLVINGAEAIGDREGYVTISTGHETLPAEEKRYSRFTATELNAGRYVFLEVHDDGHGMDEEMLSKVFDPFFTTKFVGRGLGLSALLGIVRGHKGGIDVQSESGKGTTFRLVFPVTEEAPEHVKAVAAEGRLEGTILVIDDEEIVRDVVTEMLAPQGMTVLTAEGGAAGVALYKERHAHIDLVLLDYSMPEMGGEETFRKLRKINPDVPVLLSSGFGHEEATRRFKGRGLTGFIQKPYRLDTLLEELRRCLGQG